MSREQKIYLTVCYFLIVATFVYVFSGILTLDLPRYYPELKLWSVEKLDSPSMGYYGKVGFAFLLSVPLSWLFYLFLPLIGRFRRYNRTLWRGMALSSLVFGIMFFAAEEWHEWGIKKQNGDYKLLSFLLIFSLFVSLLKLILWVEGGGEESKATSQ